jgi:hypothetical protein
MQRNNLGLIGQLGSITLFSLTALSQPLMAETLTVRVREPFNASGKADVSKLRRYCSGAVGPESSPAFTSATANYAKQLGFNRLRGLNIDNTHLSNPIDQNSVNGSGQFVPGARLKTFLKDSKQRRFIPSIVVAQQPPYFLVQKYGQAWTWSSGTWALYQDYANKFARYVALQYGGNGFNKVIFETGNEIDVAKPDEIWTQPVAGDFGSPARYAHLTKVYGIWQAAVKQASLQGGGSRKIWMAGPAITPHIMEFGTALFGINWQNRFIDDVANNGWKLDQFTFHFYGNQGAVANGQPHPFFKSLKDRIKLIQAKLRSRGLRSSIGITEWGASAFKDDSMLGKLNYSHESAAWTIGFVNDAVSANVESAIHLILRDNFGTSKVGLATISSYIYAGGAREFPKPAFNACRMVANLQGARVRTVASPSQPNLVTIASTKSGVTSVIVANYKLSYDTPTSRYIEQSKPERVSLTLSGVPFSGDATVRRYLIDANTSNIAQYLSRGATPVSSGSELQEVENYTVATSGGSVTLPEVTLGPSGVSQWIISPAR